MKRLIGARPDWLLLLATGLVLQVLNRQAGASETRNAILFTTHGKTALIGVAGSDLQYFNFSVPNQATWQPCQIFPDGKKLILLSMEPRRDTNGKSFDEYYTQTPTHIWSYDITTQGLQELCTTDRRATFVTPALLLKDGRLLIQVVRNSVGQIYNVRLDGSDGREFTKAEDGFPYGLSLSPDGRWVAYHVATRRGYQVWTSDVNGGNRRLIAADPQHLYFGTSWSPDGTMILFVDCHYQDDPGHDWADVCIGDPNGGGHRVLTSGQSMWFDATYGGRETRGGGSELPGWTRDGRILFARRRAGSKVAWEYQSRRRDTDHFNRDFKPELAWGGTEICRLDPHHGDLQALTHYEAGRWDFRASESPDGNWIAFCRARVGEPPSLWVMRADGTEAHLLTRGWNELGVDYPKWLSPAPSR